MKKVLCMLAMLSASGAFAQVRVMVAPPPPPSIRFEAAPEVVEVSPGVRVVPGYDEEVFFDDGYYWTRRDDRWWRTRDYRGGWGPVERRYVPGHLYSVPPGRYRHWRRDERREEHQERREEHQERREIRHEVRHDEHVREKEHRKDMKAERKEERREEHGH